MPCFEDESTTASEAWRLGRRLGSDGEAKATTNHIGNQAVSEAFHQYMSEVAGESKCSPRLSRASISLASAHFPSPRSARIKDPRSGRRQHKCNSTSIRPLHNECRQTSLHVPQAPTWTPHGLPATIVARPQTPTAFPDARSTPSRARRCDTPSARANTNCCTSTSYRVHPNECRRGHRTRRGMRRSQRVRARRAITMLRLSGRHCVLSSLRTRASRAGN
jgi:hypothetical protein